MLVRAYDDTDARLQEEVLKKTIPLAKQLDAQVNTCFSLIQNAFYLGCLHFNAYPVYFDVIYICL